MQPRSDAYKAAVTATVRETYVKAIVDIVSPDMIEGEVAVSAQDTDVAKPEQLWDKKFQVSANYASLEPCRWLLDGNTALLPDSADDIPDWEIGAVGLELSGADGRFAAPQTARIAFSRVHILQACSVAFSDRVEDGVAEEFTVEVFSEGTAYVRETVTGNHDAIVPITGFKIFDPAAQAAGAGGGDRAGGVRGVDGGAAQGAFHQAAVRPVLPDAALRHQYTGAGQLQPPL